MRRKTDTRKHRVLGLTIMLALVALTGCLSGITEDRRGAADGDAKRGSNETGEQAEAGPFEVTAKACEELVVYATVPAENARAFVPDGYTVIADESGHAEAWAALKTCPEGTIDGEDLGPRSQGNAGILIESPDGSGGLHFYMPWWITDREDIHRRLVAQGWHAFHEPGLSLETDLVAGDTGSVEVHIPWADGDYGMTSEVAQGPNPQEYVVTAWHEGSNGTLLMQEVLTISQHSYGPATITADAGSPAAELFGTERPGQGLFFRMSGEFTVGPPGGS